MHTNSNVAACTHTESFGVMISSINPEQGIHLCTGQPKLSARQWRQPMSFVHLKRSNPNPSDAYIRVFAHSWPTSMAAKNKNQNQIFLMPAVAREKWHVVCELKTSSTHIKESKIFRGQISNEFIEMPSNPRCRHSQCTICDAKKHAIKQSASMSVSVSTGLSVCTHGIHTHRF